MNKNNQHRTSVPELLDQVGDFALEQILDVLDEKSFLLQLGFDGIGNKVNALATLAQLQAFACIFQRKLF